MTPIVPMIPSLSIPPMARVTLAAATLVVLAAAPMDAQETPTEREAARAVVQKQMDLERSLNIDALVALAGVARRRGRAQRPASA